MHQHAIDEHPGLQDQHLLHPRAKQRNCSAFTQAKFTCTMTRRSSKQRQQQRNSETEKKTEPKEDLDSQKTSFHETPVG